MNDLKAIFRRELAGYFATPVAYVFIVVFLFATGAFTFYVGSFFERGEADLRAFSASTPGSICSSCPPSPCVSGRRSARPARSSCC